MEEKIFYVYYSYEEFGRGYIGYRKCPKNKTPETDKYLGSFKDKKFKPTEKIILFQDLTQMEALEIEIKLHNFYDIDKNPHFANKAKQTSVGFCVSAGGEKCYWFGQTPSEETKRKISKGNKGKKHSEESRRKISNAMKGENSPWFGQKLPKKTRRKMSDAKCVRIITTLCCYFSITDAKKELGISKYKFYKLFKKDPNTGFYVEIEYIREKD